ncbi:hypothetical protein Cgig2_033819 [Carnegiea gigantea]|uniref:Uncharacterized protein n=1 Tax=Carnegiea gigantea TaxID=171969 RepID=A0A9Q1Q6D8_9CARY|nr:hypothetical protein Cgig2_033819 [Carnegiea gigantea]
MVTSIGESLLNANCECCGDLVGDHDGQFGKGFDEVNHSGFVEKLVMCWSADPDDVMLTCKACPAAWPRMVLERAVEDQVSQVGLANQVRRVQSYVDALDALKTQNANPFGTSFTNSVSVSTNWETFDSGVGSLTPPSVSSSSTKMTQNWEQFE